MIFCMVAFHSKLADFLLMLWIMNFIKTVFCQKRQVKLGVRTLNVCRFTHVLVIAVQIENCLA